MTIEEFEQIVDQTILDLPEEFKTRIENVDIQVEIWPTEEDLRSIYAHPGVTLFGLYKGVALTKRGSNYNGALPDKITIFAGPIIQFSQTPEEAQKQIKKTVLHEIGHYFGMSEKAIRQAQENYQ